MLIEFHILLLFYAGLACAFGLTYIICRFFACSTDKNARLPILLACLTAVYAIILTGCRADPSSADLVPVLFWLLNEFVLFPSWNRIKFMLIGLLLFIVGVAYAVLVSTVFPSLFKNIRLTVRRKVFHFLAAGVFYAGLRLDPFGLLFAAGCLQLAFLLIEACIACNVEPIATWALSLFSKFLKSSHIRRFGLSHTSLLLALSIPVWAEAALHPDSFACRLASYAGTVSIGVGDSAASFVGTYGAETFQQSFDYWFEWRRWLPHSAEVLVGKRTIIGSLGMLISQLITWWAIVILFNGVERWLSSDGASVDSKLSPSLLYAVFWPSCAATLGELFGGDFDNLAAAGAGYLAFYI